MQQVTATCSLVKIDYSNLVVKTCRDLMVLAFSALPFHSFKHEFSFKSTLRKLHVFFSSTPFFLNQQMTLCPQRRAFTALGIIVFLGEFV